MKTKKHFSLFLLLCFIFPVSSQITDAEKKLKIVETDTVVGWKTGGLFGLNFSQTSLVNWSAGGESSVTLNGLFSAFANYKNESTAWDNSIDIGYGFLNQGELGNRKTDDKIDFLSKYGKKAFSNFYYAALLNFKTQFSAGYTYPDPTSQIKISNLFAPAYLLGAIGLNYKPNSYFSAFVSPVTGRMTMVFDDDLSAAGAFGVTPGENLKNEFGGYARISYARNDFKNEWLKNISLTSKIDLFSNYLSDPQNVDVNWETMIGMKVNKYISINIMAQLLYDYDTKFNDSNGDNVVDENDKSKIQFKEILGIGIMYKF